MESGYRREDAARFIEMYGRQHGEDLALRVYTSRLLGREAGLVLHGGGNTSVKSRVTELIGDTTDVLFVKGSGWDLAAIEPAGFPACRLSHLRRLCELPAMTDEQMVAELRANMIDPSSPTPSVEALLHALLPAKFVDHTHADAVLAVVDQPASAGLVREVFGDDVLLVPYVMPGFVLARRCAELWAEWTRAGREPSLMILDKHGIFTWGETAEESYERMIAAASRAERWLARARPSAPRRAAAAPAPDAYARVAPILRGALARASKQSWIIGWRATAALLAFAERSDLAEVTRKGCVTPDHVIRTKPWPLLLDGADASVDEGALRQRIEGALDAYATEYRAYFRRSCEARGVTPTQLDPWPRVVLVRGLGALTIGRTLADAEIAADIYEHTASVVDTTAALGGYEPVSEVDLFDLEYWSLEQAKLKKGSASAGPLDRRIGFVTGAASGIGLATARALLEAGAHVLLTDRDGAKVEGAAAELARKYGRRVAHRACDVTSEPDVRAAVREATLRFGGVDIVVSNAGAAYSGKLHAKEGDAALRASFDLNLFGHQNVARAATDVLLAQGTGGALLFNASKSAFNQGPDFGPYAVPKAALVALMRQYAVDLAPAGVRANAVNADRIRTEIFGAGVLEARAKARGVSVDEYFTANLLRRETTADDVARAFVYLATAEATTGCVVTVDGGNAAAFPR